jgi:hypothetical protein
VRRCLARTTEGGAWYLSNQEFDEATDLIEPRLREQRWFECLQLLGGEWAKQSDEKLDRYISWILERQGTSISQRAPVTALCANIVKDTSGIAELTPETRRTFERAVEGTLDAFRPSSGIPAFTQLEILEALGRLGAAVKPHLLRATKSGLYPVRRRAIEMLLPHLSDDELFDMTYVLGDRSKQPVKTYMLYLLNRDPRRTAEWLLGRRHFPGKTTDAFVDVIAEFKKVWSEDVFMSVARALFERGSSHSRWHYLSVEPWTSRARLLIELNDDHLVRSAASKDKEAGVRARAMITLVQKFPETRLGT